MESYKIEHQVQQNVGLISDNHAQPTPQPTYNYKTLDPEHENTLHIKSMPTKFIIYLNQLNSSIQNCRDKTMKKKTQPKDRRKSIDSIESDPPGSKKSYSSVENGKYTVVEGGKVNGKIHGKVWIRLSNGAVFKGEAEFGDIRSGTMEFLDGIKYQGEFKNFLFHGRGRLIYTNGTKYIADFSQGLIQKKGEILYDNGDVYRGEIRNYKKHGQGELLMRNGNKFVGQFYEGEITGFGTYYVKDFPLASGMWQKGQFLGRNLSLSLSQDTFINQA